VLLTATYLVPNAKCHMLAVAVGFQLSACLALTRHGLGIHGLGHLPIINPLYNNLGCKAATNSHVWESANCERGSVQVYQNSCRQAR